MRGKTALAIVLAHRLKDCYPDAQLFLNLRGAGADGEGYRAATKINPVTPADAMRSVIHSFKPEAQLPETFDQLTSIYRSVISDAGRVLLLLDNAAKGLRESVRSNLEQPTESLLDAIVSDVYKFGDSTVLRDDACLVAAELSPN